MAPVRVALLGCGVFARDAYLNILKTTPEAQLVAIWSRSEATLQGALPLAREVSPEVQGLHGTEGLVELLCQPEIQAVFIVIAVQGMVEAVKRCLAAGKHVLSEKPAGPRLIEVKELLHWRQLLPDAPLWCVEENFRAEGAFLRAAELLPEVGPILKLDLVADMPMNKKNRYFGSEWRRDTAGCPGGFLMDSSVHFVAALRLLARAAGWGEAVAAAAIASSTTQDLPPPDTVAGVVKFQGGQAATVSISFAGAVPRVSLLATGWKGTLEAQRAGWLCARGSCTVALQRAGQAQHSEEKLPFTGVEAAVAAFLKLVQREQQQQQQQQQPQQEQPQLQEQQPVAAAAFVAGLLEGGAEALGEGSAEALGEAARRGTEGERGAARAAAAGLAAAVPVAAASAPATDVVPPAAALEAALAAQAEQLHAQQQLEEQELEFRVSTIEAARDLALVEALLKSSAQGGRLVDVAAVGTA